MDIKLLEQLKKAGLPQEGGIMLAHGTRIAHTSDHCYCPRCTGEEYVKDPTLEELIDWCLTHNDESDGRYSFRLEREIVLDKDETLEEEWRAFRDEFGGEPSKTKKEAVAKLGLALHKEV